MPILSKAPADLRNFVMETIATYHARLTEAGVTIGVLVADPTERDMNAGEAPFLRHNGYPAYAVVAITPAKQRIQGVPDATIVIDGESWRATDEAERVARIDHEGAHLLLDVDKHGQTKTDDHGRPKLRLRKHDVQVGWFLDVAKRHGTDSTEIKQAREIQEAYGQLLFSFAEGPPAIFPGKVVA